MAQVEAAKPWWRISDSQAVYEFLLSHYLKVGPYFVSREEALV